MFCVSLLGAESSSGIIVRNCRQQSSQRLIAKTPKKKQRPKALIVLIMAKPRSQAEPHPEERAPAAHSRCPERASRRMAAWPMVRDGAEEAPPHHEVSCTDGSAEGRCLTRKASSGDRQLGGGAGQGARRRAGGDHDHERPNVKGGGEQGIARGNAHPLHGR